MRRAKAPHPAFVVDANLRDFFGTVHHEPLIDMIAEQVSDGRILKLVRQMLEARYMESGKKYATSRRFPWEMSRILNNALDTRYWQAQGLRSLLERYLALRQPFGTA